MRYIVQCEVPAPSLTIQVNIRRVILGQRLKDAHRASLFFKLPLTFALTVDTLLAFVSIASN